MHTAPLPRILLTNDDGIDAPGMAALADVAGEFTNEIWVIAPEHDESGTGQSLSLHHPLRCFPRGERRWAVSGTPADCVAIAISHFMKDTPPALILSGINAGSNTGDDVNLSGTLGGAFMGLMLGVPSISISQVCRTRKTTPWETSRAVLPKLLRHFLMQGWPNDTCLSINIPNLPPDEVKGFAWARQGKKTLESIHVEKREDLRDQHYFWMRLHDRDPTTSGEFEHAVIRRGEVCVTALSLDRSVEVSLPPVAFGT
ncbi:MAG: 5'/3'-nucleotidase SurE [Bdellovibrionales bacterium]